MSPRIGSSPWVAGVAAGAAPLPDKLGFAAAAHQRSGPSTLRRWLRVPCPRSTMPFVSGSRPRDDKASLASRWTFLAAAAIALAACGGTGRAREAAGERGSESGLAALVQRVGVRRAMDSVPALAGNPQTVTERHQLAHALGRV